MSILNQPQELDFHGRMDDSEDESEDDSGDDSDEGSESESTNAEDPSEEEDEDSFSEGPTNEALGVTSDEGDERESCPVCLNRFIGQDLGVPENCDHIFCLECIMEWSKNINTCPIDRNEFNYVQLKNRPNGKVLKLVKVRVRPKEPEEGLLQEEATLCEVCRRGDREERLLLCDACDLAYHCECLDPPLFHIPIEEWFCPPCSGILDAHKAGPSTSRSRRVIPRTSASETVRVRIQNRRTTETSVSKPSSTRRSTTKAPQKRKRRSYRRCIKKVVKLARTKGSLSGAGKGKTGTRGTRVVVTYRKRRRRRRWRKTGAKKSKKSIKFASTAENSIQSAKERIAKRLGLCKPHKGVSIPDVRSKPGSSSGSTSDRVHSLFGARDQLMDFSEKNTRNQSAESAPSSNLLDSILAGQKLLHSKADNVIIRNDGCLILKEGDKKQEVASKSKSVVRLGLSKYGAIPKKTTENTNSKSSVLLYSALTKTQQTSSSSSQHVHSEKREDVLQQHLSLPKRLDTKYSVLVKLKQSPISTDSKSDSLNSHSFKIGQPNTKLQFPSSNDTKAKKEIHSYTKVECSAPISNAASNPSESFSNSFKNLKQEISSCSDKTFAVDRFNTNSRTFKHFGIVPEQEVICSIALSEDDDETMDFDASQSLFETTGLRSTTLPSEKLDLNLKIKIECGINCEKISDDDSSCFEASQSIVEPFSSQSSSSSSSTNFPSTIPAKELNRRIKNETLSSDHIESSLYGLEKSHTRNLSSVSYPETTSEIEPSESLIGSHADQASSFNILAYETKDADTKLPFIKKEPVSSDEEYGHRENTNGSHERGTNNYQQKLKANGCRERVKDEPDTSDDELPCTQMPELPPTQCMESSLTKQLPSIDTSELSCPSAAASNQLYVFPNVHLPSTQLAEFSDDDLPCTQFAKPCSIQMSKSPSTQFTESSEEYLPCTQFKYPTSIQTSRASFQQPESCEDDLSSTQLAKPPSIQTSKLTSIQVIESCEDDLPCTQFAKPFSRQTFKLSCSDREEFFEDDLPCTQLAESSVNTLPISQYKEPLSTNATESPNFIEQTSNQLIESSEDSLPSAELAELPSTQVTKPSEVDLPCTQLVVPFLDQTHKQLRLDSKQPSATRSAKPSTTLSSMSPLAEIPLVTPLGLHTSAEETQDLSIVEIKKELPPTQMTKVLSPSCRLPPTQQMDVSITSLSPSVVEMVTVPNSGSTTQVPGNCLTPPYVSTDELVQDVEYPLQAIASTINENTSRLCDIQAVSPVLNNNVDQPSNGDLCNSMNEDSALPATQLVAPSEREAEDEELLEAKKELSSLCLNGFNLKMVKSPPKKIGVHKNLPQVITSVPCRHLPLPKPANRKTFSFEQVKQHYGLEGAPEKNNLFDGEAKVKTTCKQSMFPSGDRVNIPISNKDQVTEANKLQSFQLSNSSREFLPETQPNILCPTVPKIDCRIQNALHKKSPKSNGGTAFASKGGRSSINKEINCFDTTSRSHRHSMEEIQCLDDEGLPPTQLYSHCTERKFATAFNEKTKPLLNSAFKNNAFRTIDPKIENLNSLKVKQEPIIMDVKPKHVVCSKNVIDATIKMENNSGQSNMLRALRMKQVMNIEALQETTLRAAQKFIKREPDEHLEKDCSDKPNIKERKCDPLKEFKDSIIKSGAKHIKKEYKDKKPTDASNMHIKIEKDYDDTKKQDDSMYNETMFKGKDANDNRVKSDGKNKFVDKKSNSNSRNKFTEKDKGKKHSNKESNLDTKNKDYEKNSHADSESISDSRKRNGENYHVDKERNSDAKNTHYEKDSDDNYESSSHSRRKHEKEHPVNKELKSVSKNTHYEKDSDDNYESSSHSRRKHEKEHPVNKKLKSVSKNTHYEKDSDDNYESSSHSRRKHEKEHPVSKNKHYEKDSHRNSESSPHSKRKLGKEHHVNKERSFSIKNKHYRKDSHDNNESNNDAKIKHCDKDKNTESNSRVENKNINKDNLDEQCNSDVRNKCHEKNHCIIKESNSDAINKNPDAKCKYIEKDKSVSREKKSDVTNKHVAKDNSHKYVNKESKSYSNCENPAEFSNYQHLHSERKEVSEKHTVNEYKDKYLSNKHRKEKDIYKSIKSRQHNITNENSIEIYDRKGQSDISEKWVKSESLNKDMKTYSMKGNNKTERKKSDDIDKHSKKYSHSNMGIENQGTNVELSVSRGGTVNRSTGHSLDTMKADPVEECTRKKRTSGNRPRNSDSDSTSSEGIKKRKVSNSDQEKVYDRTHSEHLSVTKTCNSVTASSRKIKTLDCDVRNKKLCPGSVCSEDTNDSNHSQISDLQNTDPCLRKKSRHQRNAFDALHQVADAIIGSSHRPKQELENVEFEKKRTSVPEAKQQTQVANKQNLKEEIAEEVKLVLKPFYTVGVINKDDYKDIMRRAVPKIFLNCGNCVNPEKIKKLVLNYVSKLKHS